MSDALSTKSRYDFPSTYLTTGSTSPWCYVYMCFDLLLEYGGGPIRPTPFTI